MSGFRLIVPIYYLILITCIGISTYLSFKGLWSNLSWITYPSVTVIALGLFSAGLLLQLARDKQSVSQQILAIILFLMFAAASTSSNINFIYTERMWQEVRNKAFEDEYNKYKDTLKTIEAELKTSKEADQAYFEKIVSFYTVNINTEISNLKLAISNSGFFENLKQTNDTLKTELEQMKVQALDPNNLGCGTKCREHMAIIDSLVPTTDTVMPKGKTKAAITRNWGKYRNDKMNAFCSGADYSPFHTLRGLVEVIENNDFCKSTKNYSELYGSNKLENLRSSLIWQGVYSADTVKNYLTKVGQTRDELDKINTDLIALDLEFESIDFTTFEEFPRSLKAAQSMVAKEDVSFEVVDLGLFELRKNLALAVNDQEFLTVKLISVNDKSEKDFVLNLDLSQNDVVVDRDEPIQPFFELLRNKQNELISRYSDAFNTEEASEFSLINTQNGKIGEIEQTLRHAFFEMPNRTNTIFATILGIAFDIVPVIFAFVAFHGYVREEDAYDPVIG